MNIIQAINKRPETLQFLVMALLSDTYNQEGINTLKRLLGFKIGSKAIEELRMATGIIIKCDVTIHEGKLQLYCKFLGHGSYPGGEFDKLLCEAIMMIEPDALLYLIATMQEEIEEQKQKRKELIESSNNE